MTKIPGKQVSDIRLRASAMSYAVSPTGSDTTGDGISAPFATIQKALDTIAALDGNGQSAIVAPQPGTYAGASFAGEFVGWSRVSIVAASANTVVINTPLTLRPATKTPMTVRFLDFIPSAPVSGGASIDTTTDLTIRQCTFSGGITGYNYVTVADGVVRHVTSVGVSGIFDRYISAQNSVIYLSGLINAPSAATFTTFFDLPDSAIVQGSAAPATPTGTFTGRKYNASYVGVADALIPGSLAGVRSVQVFDPTLQSIADTTAAGVIQRNANESVTLLPVGATGAASLVAADAAAGRAAIDCDPAADNYSKTNVIIKTGGTTTSERWIHVPTPEGFMGRINIARSFNDDSFGYGSLSCVISSSNGVWGSAGGGAAIRIEKFGDFGWPGAFVGATNHLLREVRLVEGSSTESALSGIWLKLMGDRTYKIAGAAAAPVEYATFQPTAVSTFSAFLTPRGRGVIYATTPDYNGPDFGYEVPLVRRSPNGTRYLISVDNAGNLSTTVI